MALALVGAIAFSGKAIIVKLAGWLAAVLLPAVKNKREEAFVED
ncbi:hypothetical protein AVMA1855_13810 [Acidovorax sp. SUPP1855]|nr:hypothetical protein [Acidovorax sp. SUPP1855]GKS85236.1 hypothetical protein AVMA1855_13810 [Acidovorax sp. SUPP1855]